MNSHRLRVCYGLITALLAAALLKFALIDLNAANTTGAASAGSSLGTSLKFMFVYGLPLAVLAVAATEIIRLRQLPLHIALGNMAALVAAYLATFSEPLTSPVFSGGTLTGISLLTIGSLPALAYWILAGRRAGWRGNATERADNLAAEAFRTASENTHIDYCLQCLLGWSALGLLLLALLGWVSIDSSGLRDRLANETETQGKAALKAAGFEWAVFKVEGDYGVIEGLAPDEVQKRAVYDSVREALASATGFPGVLAQIDNHTVARMPTAAVPQQSAEAARRENEANEAVKAAQIAKDAAEAARAAEAEAKRKAGELTLALDAEIKRRNDDQSRAEERARTVEELRKAEDRARAAEAEMKRTNEELVRAKQEQVRAEDELRKTAAPAVAPVEAAQVASVDVAAGEVPAASTDSGSEAGSVSGAGSSALEPAGRSIAQNCTSQDLAIIESSRILFDMQMFEVGPVFNAELDRLAASAQACSPRPILVSGFAAAMGDSLFNPALALQRAQAIAEKLSARGIPATRVVAQSAASNSAVDNDHASNEERALSRRAEFRLLEVTELSRDATLGPDERASTCENDLTGIMAQSIIYFAMGSARIGEDSIGLIKKLATAIQTCGSVIVTVEGHTDKLGAASYNQGLSESRAKAVREALMAAGADQTRLAARGFASSRPHDTADTAEAFALNRRIEFKVSGKFAANATGGT